MKPSLASMNRKIKKLEDNIRANSKELGAIKEEKNKILEQKDKERSEKLLKETLDYFNSCIGKCYRIGNTFFVPFSIDKNDKENTILRYRELSVSDIKECSPTRLNYLKNGFYTLFNPHHTYEDSKENSKHVMNMFNDRYLVNNEEISSFIDTVISEIDSMLVELIHKLGEKNVQTSEE